MRIMEKFMQKARDNWNAAPVTLAFLGDSVTQGCFELYIKNDGLHETVLTSTAHTISTCLRC